MQPVALNDHSFNRAERIPDGDHCYKSMVQVAHVAFWDWMFNFAARDWLGPKLCQPQTFNAYADDAAAYEPSSLSRL